MAKDATESPDFKYIVRLADTDLDGKGRVEPSIAKVKGVGIRLAALVAERAQVDRYMRVGDITDAQVEALKEAIEKIPELAPIWMLNRQKDLESGEDLHYYGTDLESKKRDDLNRMKKIRTWRGVRHELGQKVRGQRSRSNGRTGLAVGVIKKKEGQPSSGDKK